MQTLLHILATWFLISIPTGLVVGWFLSESDKEENRLLVKRVNASSTSEEPRLRVLPRREKSKSA